MEIGAKRFETLAKAAGCRRIRTHDLRHTAASLLLDQGVPPVVVAELLGHANSAITASIYAHAVPGSSAAAAGALTGSLVAQTAAASERVDAEESGVVQLRAARRA